MFKLFDAVAAVGETLFDEVSGKSDRRRKQWAEEVHDNAKAYRKKLTQTAYGLWLRRNESEKSELFEQDQHNRDAQRALLTTKLMLESSDKRPSNETSSKKNKNLFHVPSPLGGVSKKIVKSFPYDSDGYFYKGKQDDFIDHLDNFMRSELQGQPALLNKWKICIKEARSIEV